MLYKYSICYPNKADIEYRSDELDTDQVMLLAKKYPWMDQLELSEGMPQEKVNYSPSIDFTNTKTKHSFCLTADLEKSQLMFSLWYNRPVKKKVLFGLLGEQTVMEVTDKWSFDHETALNHLEIFLKEDYASIEKLMTG
jgi:hypothetical protein